MKKRVLSLVLTILVALPQVGLLAHAQETEGILSGLVSYIDEYGEMASVDEYTTLSSDEGEYILTAGYYVAQGVFSNTGSLTISGEVKLILADDAEMSVLGSMKKDAIRLESGGILRIYAQSTGESRGVLRVFGADADTGWDSGATGISSGSVYVYGGEIDVSGGDSRTNDPRGGMGVNIELLEIVAGKITVRGGNAISEVKEAMDSSGGDALRSWNLNIYGGEVYAFGGSASAIGEYIMTSGGKGLDVNNLTMATGTLEVQGGEANGIRDSYGGSGGSISKGTIDDGSILATGQSRSYGLYIGDVTMYGGNLTAHGNGGGGTGSQGVGLLGEKLTISSATVSVKGSENENEAAADMKIISLLTVTDGATLMLEQYGLMAKEYQFDNCTITGAGATGIDGIYGVGGGLPESVDNIPNPIDISEGNISITEGAVPGTMDITFGRAPQKVAAGLADNTPIRVTGSSMVHTVTASGSINIDLTLEEAHIKNDYRSLLSLSNGIHVDLTLEGDNHLVTDANNALSVPEGTAVVIDGTGSLKSHSSSRAGIGGGRNAGGGNITINGGIIDAKGGAAIGGGRNAGGGNITINGGEITAKGDSYSATIGGGYNGAGGNILITGGIVTVYAGTYGAGIGGEGGPVNIDITGGDITVHGGTYGAAIGNGMDTSTFANINISGGKVTAYGGMYGAAIGGGSDSKGGNVTISGSDTVVIANSASCDIGSIGYASSNSGTLTVSDGAKVYLEGKGTNIPDPSFTDCFIGGEGAGDTAGAYGSGGEQLEIASYINESAEQDEIGIIRTLVADEGEIILTEGAYLVSGSFTNQGTVTISGKVKLILEDGADYAIAGTDGKNAVQIDNYSSLSVFSQSLGDQMGKMNITAASQSATGTSSAYGNDGITYGEGLYIYGGDTTIKGGDASSVQGYASGGRGVYTKNLEIHRGSLTAIGGNATSESGYSGGDSGVYAYSLKVYGGSLVAVGGNGNNSAGLGIGPSSEIIISGGEVSATGGESENGAALDINVYGKLDISGGAVLHLNKGGFNFDTFSFVNCTIAGGGAGGIAGVYGDAPQEVDVLPIIDMAEGNLIISEGEQQGTINVLFDMGPMKIAKGIPESTPIFVTGESQVFVVTVEENAEANLYFTDVNLRNDKTSPVSIASGSVASITLEGDNSLVSSSWGSPGIKVNEGGHLIINGPGLLHAENTDGMGSMAAGIGGGGSEQAGDITINGGTITAYGCAGIGSGEGSDAGNITITGGSVTAIAVGAGSGIGAGGYHGFGGHILITGGEVTAIGSGADSGIGGNGGTVTIEGGIVTATGGMGSAGIGGGSGNLAVDILITGGVITATGGNNGAGIGSGAYADTGNITITGGTVTAFGGANAAGIGGGNDSPGANVTISGENTVVRATGGETGYDVGSSLSSEEQGSLTVSDGATLYLEKNGTKAQPLDMESCTVGGAGAGNIAGFYDENGVQTAAIHYLDEEGSWNMHPSDEVTIIDASNIGDFTTLTEGWYLIRGTISYSEQINISGEVNIILEDNSHLTMSGASKDVGFVNKDGMTLSFYAQSEGAGMGKLSSSGKFAIEGGRTVNEEYGTIIINGGDYDLKASDWGGIIIGGSYSTVIINGGKITATPSSYGGQGIGGYAATVIINGGDITTTGNAYGTGIGARSVTINGGKVYASGKDNGLNSGKAGIDTGGEGYVVINGGQVTVKGAPGAGVDIFTLHLTVSGGAVLTLEQYGVKSSYNIFENCEIIDSGSGELTGVYPALAEEVLPEELDIANGDIVLFPGAQDDTIDIVFLDGDAKIATGLPKNSPIVVTGSTTDYGIFVHDGVSADITLKNVNIRRWQGAAFYAEEGSKVDVTLDGDNVLVSEDGFAGITVKKDAAVTIDGEGSLDAKGMWSGAGIGSGDFWRNSDTLVSGSITINGGIITATGAAAETYSSTGIGGIGGDITINGGTVKAVGGKNVAGIFTDEEITLNGGTVIAVGGSNAPGISTKDTRWSDEKGTIGEGSVTINGGKIYAEGGAQFGDIYTRSLNVSGGAELYFVANGPQVSYAIFENCTVSGSASKDLAGVYTSMEEGSFEQAFDLSQGSIILLKGDQDGTIDIVHNSKSPKIIKALAQDTPITIIGETDTHSIFVESGLQVDLTINSVSIENLPCMMPFYVESGSEANITLVGDSSIVALENGEDRAAISVVLGVEITIDGDGSLYTKGSGRYPAIGFGSDYDMEPYVGTINIKGGVIHAESGATGRVGIGSGVFFHGMENDESAVYIDGGSVYALNQYQEIAISPEPRSSVENGNSTLHLRTFSSGSTEEIAVLEALPYYKRAVVDEGETVYYWIKNIAPIIVKGKDKQAGEAYPGSIIYTADVSEWFEDLNGDSLTYHLVSPLEDPTVTLSGGILSYDPLPEDLDTFKEIEIKAKDGEYYSEKSVIVRVRVGDVLIDYSIEATAQGLGSLQVGKAVENAKIIYTLSEPSYETSIISKDFLIGGLPAGLTNGSPVLVNNRTVELPVIGTPTTANESPVKLTLPHKISAANMVSAFDDVVPTGDIQAGPVALGEGTAILDTVYTTYAEGLTLESVLAETAYKGYNFERQDRLLTVADSGLVVTGYKDHAQPQNYEPSRATLTIIVERAIPTVGELAYDRTSVLYDGSAKFVPISAKDGVTGLGEIVAVKYNDSITQPVNAGQYMVAVDLAQGINYQAATIVLGNFTVGRANPTQELFDYQLTPVVYDGTSKAVAVGLNGSVSGLGSFEVKYNGSATVPTNAGVYTISLEVQDGLNYLPAASLELGNFVINKATATAGLLNVNMVNEVYDGTEKAVSVSAESGIVGLGEITVRYNGLTGAPTDAGVYSVTIDIAEGTNYKAVSNFSLGDFTIRKATPSVQMLQYSLGNYTYDGSPRSAEVKVKDSVIGLGTVSVRYGGGTVLPVNAGVYEVTATVVANENYHGAMLILGNLIIEKANPTAEILRYDLSERTYDGKQKPVKVSVGSGIIGLGSISVQYDGGYTAPVNAGTYTITALISSGINYNALNVPLGEITINCAKPTVELLDFDLNPQRYDGSAKPITVVAKGGVNGLGDIAVKYNGMDDVPVNVGEYEITAEIGSGVNYTEAKLKLGEFTIASGLHLVTLNVRLDGSEYIGHGKAFHLWQDGIIKGSGIGDHGTVTFNVQNGTYDLYEGSIYTGKTVTVLNNDSTGLSVDYYTVNYAVTDVNDANGSTINALCDGKTVMPGETVLAGSRLLLSVVGIGADVYTYAWHGNDANGQATNSMTIAAVHSAVDVMCTVTGTLTEYAVSYLPNGASGSAPQPEMYKQGMVFTIPDAGGLVNGDSLFGGWNDGRLTYAPGSTYIMQGRRINFTAQWQSTYDVGGSVVYEEGGFVSGASVKLMRGNRQFGDMFDIDLSGDFSFTGVPNGKYNIVVQINETIVTQLIEIFDGDIVGILIVIPAGNKNSIVEVIGNTTPDIIVGNLEKQFVEESNNETFTPNDASIVRNGGTVELKFAATEKAEEEVIVDAQLIKTDIDEGLDISMYIDFAVQKTVLDSSGNRVEQGNVSVVPELLKIVMPLPEWMQGRSRYNIYRVHNGVREILPLGGDEGEERFEEEKVNGKTVSLIVYALKFSTYAVGALGLSNESEITSVIKPERAGIIGTNITATIENSISSQLVDLEVSEGAVWNMYTDAACSNEVIDRKATLAVGANTYYIKVVSESGESNVYGLTMIRAEQKDKDEDSDNEPDKKPDEKPDENPEKEPDKKPEQKEGEGILNTTDHMAYIKGDATGNFLPNKSMTRAEAAMIFYRLLKDKNVKREGTFKDVSDNQWYSEAVYTLSALEIIRGYPSGEFKPNVAMTRAEFVTVLARFYEAKDTGVRFPDVKETYWAFKAITTAASYGWAGGYPDGSFKPNNQLTRAEAVKLINSALNRNADKEYIDSAQNLTTFPDVKKGFWAYYYIMEAANGHSYEIVNKKEIWK